MEILEALAKLYVFVITAVIIVVSALIGFVLGAWIF